MSPPTMFTVPVLRYLHSHGLTPRAPADVAVGQRQWAARNPRALFKERLTAEDVLQARMVAYPFTLLMCCPKTDGGGALVLASAERASQFKNKPVYLIGSGESCETPIVSQMDDLASSRAFRDSGRAAFESAGITHADVDHVMIYDAFAHLPLYGLEDLGFCKPGEAAGFIASGQTAPGGSLPTNTNGGGLSYMHSGMYGMYAIQENVRQLRGIAPAQVEDARVSSAMVSAACSAPRAPSCFPPKLETSMSIGKWALERPDHVAVIHAETGAQLSYAALTDRSRRLAAALRQHGFKSGDRLALFMENHLFYMEVVWAALTCGLYLVPINRYASAEECGHILDDSGCAAIISSVSRAETCRQLAGRSPHCTLRLMVDGLVGGWSSYEQLLDDAPIGTHGDGEMGNFLSYT